MGERLEKRERERERKKERELNRGTTRESSLLSRAAAAGLCFFFFFFLLLPLLPPPPSSTAPRAGPARFSLPRDDFSERRRRRKAREARSARGLPRRRRTRERRRKPSNCAREKKETPPPPSALLLLFLLQKNTQIERKRRTHFHEVYRENEKTRKRRAKKVAERRTRSGSAPVVASPFSFLSFITPTLPLLPTFLSPSLFSHSKRTPPQGDATLLVLFAHEAKIKTTQRNAL